MIRTVSACSVYATTNTRPCTDAPMVKNRGGFAKINVMFLEIGRSLRGIPGKHHEASIAPSSVNVPERRTALPGAEGKWPCEGLRCRRRKAGRSSRLFGLVEVDEPREVLEQFSR